MVGTDGIIKDTEYMSKLPLFMVSFAVSIVYYSLDKEEGRQKNNQVNVIQRQQYKTYPCTSNVLYQGTRWVGFFLKPHDY